MDGVAVVDVAEDGAAPFNLKGESSNPGIGIPDVSIFRLYKLVV
jgi:hypothetical protein